MKNSKSTSTHYINRKIFSTLIVPLFLLISAVVIVGSGCTRDPDTVFSYKVVFSAPTNNAIYFTDNLNNAGESLGPDIVEIQAKVTSKAYAIESIIMQIRNSASVLVAKKEFTIEPETYLYSISETFQTSIADDYRVTIITSYVSAGTGGAIYYDPTGFTYQDLSSGGPTDN